MDSNPNNYANDSNLELSWAIAAYDHAETYYNLLTVVPDVRYLRLSLIDDKIYREFCKQFPHLDLGCFSEGDIKSEDQKQVWRPFCMEFEHVVEDYNRGTLMRLDCSQGYEEANTCIVPRIQFLAIEIARNRQGLNNRVRKLAAVL